ncbi:MAG: PAS domain S-box protein [Bacteroidetes bacterium]|nr:PAS domain S-box protein [Bacteroidota bacterium]
MKGTNEKRLTRGIAVTIAIVLAIVILSIWQYRRIQENGTIIRRTNLILYQIQEVQNNSVQYELSIKNFQLTHDSAFLKLAADSVAVLPARVATLKTLIADQPLEQKRIDSVTYYVNANQGPQAQQLLTRFSRDVRQLLEDRRARNQNRASQLQYVLWTLTAAVIALAYVTYRKNMIDLSRGKMIRERLRQSNRVLEEEVRLQSVNLQSSEEKYKTLFNKSPLPKWIYDEDTLRFLEVNDTAIANYGYSREEFMAMTIADIRPKEDWERLYADVAEIRRHPETNRNGQWRHLKKSGEMIDVDVTAHSIRFEGKNARMVVAHDVTERKIHEEQTRRLNLDLARRAGELASSNAELERFAYIASHDLQEPLRMVSSFLQLLQKKYGGQLDAKADQYIHYAVDGAERMKALIMDLLEYSRVGTGKESFTWVDTSEVLKEVGDVFREKIISARATVNIGPMPTVWGDKVQVTQLFQNLISNALKYQSEAPPVISISATEAETHYQFSIEDNGIGIDPQFFDKIFIIFQRLHNKSDYSGTGIGLAICKKIVERHGGKIWVESTPQKGSTFYFTIIKKVNS